MKAISINGSSPSAIQAVLKQNLSGGYKPTLAIIFLSRIEDIAVITTMLDAEGIAIFGVSTSEKFSDQGIEEKGIVVLLLDMHPDNFKVVLQNFRSPAEAYEAASAVGKTGKETFDRPAFIISTADIRIPGEQLIKGLLDAAGADVSVIGGVAGNPADFSGIVFTNGSTSNSGIISLILDEEKVEVKGVAVSGWKPVGTEKTITQCDGNWVFTIDNEPAMAVVKKFLGRGIMEVGKPEGLDSFPLQVQRAAGKPMMRPIVLWNPDNQSVMLGAPVQNGSTFRFSLPPDLEVIDTVIDSSKKIKEEELPDADALLMFSCVGRLANLGPMLSMELDGMAATWNVPMAGFFSLGEFGKLDDTRPEFHGTTVSWVALKEK